MRCLYCGETSWGLFRRFRDPEFCSRDHRESYQKRLRKFAGETSEYPNFILEAEQAAAAAGIPKDALCGVLLPLPDLDAAVPAAKLQPTLVVRDETVVPERVEGVQPPPVVSAQALPGLLSSDRQIWIPAEIVSPVAIPAAAASAVGAMLPLTLENSVRLKRWGLKIRFLKS